MNATSLPEQFCLEQLGQSLVMQMGFPNVTLWSYAPRSFMSLVFRSWHPLLPTFCASRTWHALKSPSIRIARETHECQSQEQKTRPRNILQALVPTAKHHGFYAKIQKTKQETETITLTAHSFLSSLVTLIIENASSLQRPCLKDAAEGVGGLRPDTVAAACEAYLCKNVCSV